MYGKELRYPNIYSKYGIPVHKFIALDLTFLGLVFFFFFNKNWQFSYSFKKIFFVVGYPLFEYQLELS